MNLMKELPSKYNPAEVEDKWYAYWMEHKLFSSKPDAREPYTVVIPPPNVTGVLHMGHMLNETIQDILVRRARMQGKNACWVPGTDHASIATETKVIAKLAAEGIKKTDLTREEFLEHAWDWTRHHGGIILQQLRKLGCSCDWDRTAFTMDPLRSESVTKVFCDLYDKGLIYRGLRMVNWDPVNRTAISDDEVYFVEEQSKLYYLRYYLAPGETSDAVSEEGGNVVHIDADGRRYAVVATTRPETIMGDTAMCINPKDPKNRWLQGKKVIVPLVGREIPVIEDRYVEVDFGTGCLKVTPAHDKNDYMLGKTHNLPSIDIFNEDGTLSEEAGMYIGMDRFEVRRQIAEDLQQAGLMEKIEDYVNNVGFSERTKVPIEPRLSLQWFVNMKHFADISLSPVMEDIIKFVPEKYKTTYRVWLENIQDWCISRQLWWGHRIPAYYCDKCGEIVVAKDVPSVCPKCGETHFTQDPDTLDTWFSSALWPFSTLGWPEKTEDLEYFYPTDVLVTGYDIIFFWVIRMIFSGYEQMGEKPFKTVLFHGLVRDSQGRKMSKSLGNGIDPLEIIDQYGADALRLTLITGNAPGNDMRFYYERVEASRNFANKVWNASRFIMMNMDQEEEKTGKRGWEVSYEEIQNSLYPVDKWILSKLNTLVKEVTDNMDSFELGIAVQKVYDFIWDEFCDWYIEMVKPRLYSTDEEDSEGKRAALWTLQNVLTSALKLLHPYMPFITEEIFCTLQTKEESIMVSEWPVFREDRQFTKEENAIELMKEAVRGIRNVRTEMNVAPGKKAAVFVVSDKEGVRQIFEEGRQFFTSLAAASELTVQADKSGIDDSAVSVVIPNATVYIPFEELVDIAQEIERLQKEQKRLEGELARVQGMLGNERFLSKAPKQKVDEERAKLEKYTQMKAQVEERLAQLN